MEKECAKIWLCCNDGQEELVYPDEIMRFWANNSLTTIHIKQ